MVNIKKDDEKSSSRDDSENVFDIEDVLEERTQDGRKQYLIKWLDYDPSFNTWEPFENLSTKSLQLWENKKKET